MAEIQVNQTEITRPHGGARRGAGRESISRKILHDPRYLAARGVNPLFAAEVLSHVVDERRAWQRIFSSEDDRVVLQALQFLVAMRDGKPAQRINVTSTSLQLNASDLERARAIVAEIRSDSALDTSSDTCLSHSSDGASADSGLLRDRPRLGAGDTAGMVLVDSGRDSEDVAVSSANESETQHNASKR